MATASPLDEAPDFSLVLGGPIFQIFRRAHLTGPALELLHRRVVTAVAIAWLPPFFLSMISGRLLGGPGLSFLRDIETHARLLVAVPVLIFAELIVHRRVRKVVKTFLDRGIITSEDTQKFRAALDFATRVRDSILIEIALLIFAFTVGHWAWTSEVALGTPTWYATPAGGHLHLTLPGYWYAFFSVPLYQFLIFRWYFRLLNWLFFLWRVSRMNLHLIALHPDLAGGLGFLGKSTYAFAPILLAQGAMLSGVIADRILYGGQNLMSFKMTILGFVSWFVLLILGPLFVFVSQLARAKYVGLAEYGTLATSYVEDFNKKWLRDRAQGEAILGSGDIQSLADLANSYAVVREMRIVPFSLNDVGILVAATMAPFVPLLLTIMPLEELLTSLAKILL